jgi:hypothetical protein
MAFKDISSREAVLKAIHEYDELGEEAFLNRYGYYPAKVYFLVVNGKRYPSKAIVGVAHGYQFPEQGPLKSADFVGGENTVKRKLEKLGFEVIRIVDGIVINDHSKGKVKGRKIPITGYWIFMCNPAKWQIDRFLETGKVYDQWHIPEWYVKHCKPGQLAVVRVGIDTRNKAQLEGHKKLESGIYAVAEILSSPEARKDDPDPYWLEWEERDWKRKSVKIKYVQNLMAKPLLINDMKRDPILGNDRILIYGFPQAAMPMREEAFRRIFDHVGAEEYIEHNIESETVETTEEVLKQEDKYRHAVPEVKEVISKRIERGPIANQIKKINGYKCMVCEAMGINPYAFKKRNGERYIEAHHVHPVADLDAGSLHISNIITICPNHHRQMHYGNADLVDEGRDFFTFKIDGNEIRIMKVTL